MKTDRARSTERPVNGQPPDRGGTESPRTVPVELDQLIERAGARFAVDLESLTRDLPRSTKPVAPPEAPHVPRPPDRAARRDVAAALRPYDPRGTGEDRRTAGDDAPATAPSSTVSPPTAGPPKRSYDGDSLGHAGPGGRPIWWIGTGVAAAVILVGALIAVRLSGPGAATAETPAAATRPIGSSAAAGASAPAAASIAVAAVGVPDVVAPATSEPVRAAPATSPPAAAGPALRVPPSLPTAVIWRSVLDHRFATPPGGWPDNPTGTAFTAGGVYRLHASQPPRFVAIDAPLSGPIGDTRVRATFRKAGGPPGGGYGVILRGQNPGTRDGTHQGGRYYVLEVGDRGEVGAWRREDDRWIDLLPWTPSAAVRPGPATNDLIAEAIGPRLTLRVNGVEAISVTDAVLTAGSAGIFVGGDLNEVAVEHFAVETAG